MNTSAPDRWHIGRPARVESRDRVVAFTASELHDARPHAASAVAFHDAVRAPLPRAGRVDVHVPPYRPRRFVPVLAWLAARLGRADAEATWHLERKQGPKSVRALLEGAGWQLDEHREGRAVYLVGRLPAKVPVPDTATFDTVLGSHPVTFAADHGVFSSERVDDGTALLLDVTLGHPPVDVIADIGVGYGALAVGLVVNGVARESAGTDIDSVALWLAGRNAEANGVALSLRCTPDPEGVQPTPLTVCNIPTHINAKETALFMTGLAHRATYGTVLAVVHASLEERYVGHLTSRGLRVGRHPGASHVVLEATQARR